MGPKGVLESKVILERPSGELKQRPCSVMVNAFDF